MARSHPEKASQLLILRLVKSDDYQLKELPVEPAAQGKGLVSIRKEHPGLVLGAVHEGHVTMGVTQDLVLGEGDQLIVLEPADS